MESKKQRLLQGLLSKKDVLCLLAETHVNYPDSRAAAAIVEKLDKLLPKIKIDEKILKNIDLQYYWHNEIQYLLAIIYKVKDLSNDEFRKLEGNSDKLVS